MKLAMRLPERKGAEAAADADPRETASAEVIDLASRTSYPAVANRKSKSDALTLFAGAGFVMLLGAATLWGLNASNMEEPVAEAAPAPVPAIPEEAYTMVPEVPMDGEVVMDQPQPSMMGAAPAPVYSQPPMAQPQAYANPYSSPTLVFDGSAAPGGGVVSAPANAPSASDGAAIPGSGTAGDFAARIGGIGGGPAMARQDINPATTVATGTMIPAILETAIDTDVPGYVRAVVSQDVRSFDGSRVLIPRSSRLVGQYQSGLQAGQRRAYVIWTQVIRPDGVSVNISSPATGFDGTTGIAGDVNNHFFSRFGSAMLMSVIGGLSTIASGGASIIMGGGQSAANTALQQDGQRPPTIRVRQGEPVRVYTARHLDFSLAPKL